MARPKSASIDEYIAGFPEETQHVLEKIRATIKKAAPGAEEMISYAIPAFKHEGSYLVYFAGYKNHVAIYPLPKGDEAFDEAVAPYKSGKATVQFPLDRPLPVTLITKFVKFSIKASAERKKAKKK